MIIKNDESIDGRSIQSEDASQELVTQRDTFSGHLYKVAKSNSRTIAISIMLWILCLVISGYTAWFVYDTIISMNSDAGVLALVMASACLLIGLRIMLARRTMAVKDEMEQTNLD